MSPRIPRKMKKWHKKMGYTTHFGADGRAYWTRDSQIIRPISGYDLYVANRYMGW